MLEIFIVTCESSYNCDETFILKVTTDYDDAKIYIKNYIRESKVYYTRLDINLLFTLNHVKLHSKHRDVLIQYEDYSMNAVNKYFDIDELYSIISYKFKVDTPIPNQSNIFLYLITRQSPDCRLIDWPIEHVGFYQIMEASIVSEQLDNYINTPCESYCVRKYPLCFEKPINLVEEKRNEIICNILDYEQI